MKRNSEFEMNPATLPFRKKIVRTILFFLTAAFVLCLSSTLTSEKKQNRYDDLADELVSKIVDSPSSTRAYLNFIDILRIWDVTSPGKVDGAIKKISSKKNLHPQARMLVHSYQAAVHSRTGNFKKAEDAVGDSGILTSWLVIGPFDNEDLKGHEREMGPELDLGKPVSLSLAYEGDERAVKWRKAGADPLSGILYFRRFLHPAVKVCGYAGTYIESHKDKNVVFWGSSSGTLALWIDGVKIVDDSVYRRFGPMRHAASVKLKKGTHKLMTKVCIDTGEWKVSVQTTNAKGGPAALRHAADFSSFKKPYKGPSKALKHTEYKTAFSELKKLAENEENTEAAGDFARLLFLTNADDVKSNKAPDFAGRAADASGECGDYITLALTTDDENRSYKALKKCLKSEPDNAEASYLILHKFRDIMHFPDYAGEVNWMAGKFPHDPMIAVMKVGLLEDSGMPLKAFKELKKLRTQFGDISMLIEKLGNLAPAAASRKENIQLLDETLKIMADNLLIRSDYLKHLIKEGDFDGARKEIEVLLEYFWVSESAVKSAVQEYIAMNELEKAEKILTAETEMAPHNPEVWEGLGAFYNMTGENRLAMTCFQTVLQLNPQNVQVRQYISNLIPEEKFEKAYIRSDEFIKKLNKKLKPKGKKEGDPFATENIDITILVEQEIDRVYENGTSARFVQRSLRINTEQGAKLQRYQFVSYSPTRQDLKILRAAVIHPDGTVEDSTGRFTIPIVEEEFRLYYDDANEIIEMPSLKPGDIIDVQYKLSDAGVRNMWERHFGNVVALQGLYPKIYFRFEIIADKTIKLNFDTPACAGLKYSKKEGKNNNTYRWEAKEIPPIIPEPEMPPLAELSPLIRVSTFSSWEEFGKWWWALASGQMVLDKNIKEQVRELVKDKKTDDEKIAAIFDWVIRSTRYVGLEFGIHGFKPYRTTEVLSRGFGDCKDKATLLYVMLEEAGVDAAIALVRTRGSGEINPSFPFQFLFDHAIAAVPSRNLFLDGTVDYLDYNTLPTGDQGVFSLVISEGKIETARTAVLPSMSNTQQIDIELALESSGDANVHGMILATGAITSHYRYMYQTTGTRKERFENELSSIFPGVAVQSQSFEGLEDFSKDIKADFSAFVPGLAMVSESEMQITALPSYNLYKKYASRSKRKYPVLVGHQRVFIDRYIYKAPEGMIFSQIPRSVVIGSKDAGYSFILNAIQVKPAELEINAILQISTFRIELDQYDKFREFCRKVDEATSQRIHIDKVGS